MRTNVVLVSVLWLLIGSSAFGADRDDRNPGGFTVTGSGAEVSLNASSNTSPKLTFYENGTVRWTLYQNHMTDNFSLSSATHAGLLTIDQNGGMALDYSGTTNGLTVTGSTDQALVSFENTFGTPTDTTTALSAGISSATASSDSVAIYGHNSGLGYGIYGRNDLYSTYGLLGGSWFGVLGSGTETAGVLGTFSYGVYGEHDERENWGALGTDNYGVVGVLRSSAVGNYAIYGSGVNNEAFGSSYAYDGSLGGVKGINPNGNTFTFGVAGFSSLTSNRSGASLGSNNSSSFGCLAYRASNGTTYGGYFTSYTSGTGVALAGSGQLMGGWIRGESYGLYLQGDRYAQYAQGDTYASGVVAMVQDTGNERKVMYAPSSSTVDVYSYGIGQISKGTAQPRFDAGFRNLVADKDSIVVTITPIGQSAQLFIQEITADGFTIRSETDDAPDVRFTWIAIGKRKGFENHKAPDEILDAQFDANMSQVTLSDSDKTRDALGMYRQDGTLKFGPVPQESSQELSE
mgnify:CR=1 FL=1